MGGLVAKEVNGMTGGKKTNRPRGERGRRTSETRTEEWGGCREGGNSNNPEVFSRSALLTPDGTRESQDTAKTVRAVYRLQHPSTSPLPHGNRIRLSRFMPSAWCLLVARQRLYSRSCRSLPAPSHPVSKCIVSTNSSRILLLCIGMSSRDNSYLEGLNSSSHIAQPYRILAIFLHL